MTGKPNQRPCLRRATAFLLSLMIASAFQGRSQTGAPFQQPKQARDTFRIRVGLAQVDLTVSDKKGKFIDGLTADQLDLLVDDKPQPISFLDLISTVGPPGERTLAGEGTGKVSIQGSSDTSPPEAGRTLLFFLDDWRLSGESIMRARVALSRLIDMVMGPNDRAAVFAASRQLGFLEQVTDNKSVLKQAVTRLIFNNDGVSDLTRPPMNEAQALAIEQEDWQILQYFVDGTMRAMKMDESRRDEAEDLVRFRAYGIAELSAAITARSLASLSNILRSCAVLPGRKVVFYLSDGFMLQQQRDDVAYRLKQAVDAALNAGIVIYSLDTRGLTVDPSDDAYNMMKYAVPPPGLSGGGFSNAMMGQNGMNALASDTGGRLLRNNNSFEDEIVVGLQEASRYYLLGWYVDLDKVVPGLKNRIRVVVKERPDLKAQVRQSSLDLSRLVSEEKRRAALTVPRETGEKELIRALRDYPWPIDGLPTLVYSGFAYDPVRESYVLSTVSQVVLEGGESVDANNGSSPEFLGFVYNRDGNMVASFGTITPGLEDASDAVVRKDDSFIYSCRIPVYPGIYQVRVAAQDPGSRRVGSAHQWVYIPIPVPGEVQMGSIFLKEPSPGALRRTGFHPETFDQSSVSAGRRFSVGVDLSFLVQIISPSSTSVFMETKIYRGNQMVKSTNPQSVTIPYPENPAPLFIGGEVPIEGLAAGSYKLEITASDPVRKTTAMQRIAFWIQ
jgi:VWFA-related protein